MEITTLLMFFLSLLAIGIIGASFYWLELSYRKKALKEQSPFYSQTNKY